MLHPEMQDAKCKMQKGLATESNRLHFEFCVLNDAAYSSSSCLWLCELRGSISLPAVLWRGLHGNRARRRLLRDDRCGTRNGISNREIRQQRDTRARHLKVTGRNGSIGLGLLALHSRIRQLELRRDAGAIADVGDLVRAIGLLDCPGGGLPRDARRKKLRPRRSRVERGDLLHLAFLQKRLFELRARDLLVTSLPPASQQRHAHADTDGPVRSIEGWRGDVLWIGDARIVRVQGHARHLL